jgi:uncharacterized protein (TIGR02246 family)
MARRVRFDDDVERRSAARHSPRPVRIGQPVLRSANGFEEVPVSQHDLDGVIAAYRQALHAFLQGDPEPVLDLFSRRDDVTLANPLGPPHRGRADVEQAIRTAAANFKAGTVDFEEVSRYSTPGLGYVVWLEPSEVQLADTNNMVRISLRVTMIFRREEDMWRVAHRHADPITTPQSVSAIVES